MASEHEIKFHRSFLSLNLSLRIWNEDYNYQNTRGGPPDRQSKIQSDPVYAYHVQAGPHWPAKPPGDPAARDRKYNAQLTHADGRLEPLVITTKRGMSGQNFATGATPWELTHSVMCGGQFGPIVNSMMEVTGHYANIDDAQLIYPKGIKFSTPAEYVQNEVQLYLWMEGSHWKNAPEGWEAFREFHGGIDVLVLTNGEVIGANGRPFQRNNGHAYSVMSPLDFWAPGSRLLASGIRALTSRAGAAVKLGYKALAAPTRELAEATVLRLMPKPAQSAWREVAGITKPHHDVFIHAAKQEQLIIVVRHTNPKSIPLIEKGCPGKPKNLEFINTSPDTGIVMANTGVEIAKAQRLGYYVVNADGKTAARFVKLGDKEVPEIITLKSPFWKVEKGQVIDPALQKPIVGDYDLMGVINPKNAGQNINLVAKNGELVTDVTNPVVQRAAKAVNDKMDMKRVLHGAQDGYKGFRKGASAFEPDGTVKHFVTEGEVKAYYESLGRQTRVGAHPRPSPGTPVDDEVARMRARKQGGR